MSYSDVIRSTDERVLVGAERIIPFLFTAPVDGGTVLIPLIVWLRFTPSSEVHLGAVRPHEAAFFVDIVEPNPCLFAPGQVLHQDEFFLTVN